MLTIYTHSTNPTHKEFWKSIIQKVVRRYSGPHAVRDSLLRGLKENQIEYELNPTKSNDDTVLVLSGIEALKNAIRAKKRGEIKKLIAGPNITITPNDSNNVMYEDAIDTILVPSQWVADFWKREAAELSEKIFVWAAGVAIKNPSSRAGTPVIYDKMRSKELLTIADKVVKSTGKTPTVFTYGTYSHSEYLRALSDAPYLIYLAQSESQGLSLQEAWAHNVPTFVNKSTKWTHKDYTFEATQINTPYLTDELGGIFSNAHELASLVADAKTFNPKHYCDKHLSDDASIKTLLPLL
ncbi:hypothetical protein CL644_01725 [bacterium]|nr:hypothetical protein [bacterium]|tara:strand:- start:2439 stop:3326 length:888 start_codon:yes stop_codon:yes gene_type:complete